MPDRLLAVRDWLAMLADGDHLTLRRIGVDGSATSAYDVVSTTDPARVAIRPTGTTRAVSYLIPAAGASVVDNALVAPSGKTRWELT